MMFFIILRDHVNKVRNLLICSATPENLLTLLKEVIDMVALRGVGKFLVFHFWVKGRLNRLSYFVWFLASFPIFYAICIPLVEIMGVFGMSLSMLLWLWIGTTNSIKRLHDMNLSGWWICLLYLSLMPLFQISMIFNIMGFRHITPLTYDFNHFILSRIGSFYWLFVGLLVVEVIFLFVAPGKKGDNRFGPNQAAKRFCKVLLGQD